MNGHPDVEARHSPRTHARVRCSTATATVGQMVLRHADSRRYVPGY
jgi:hypothetical protein